MNGNAYNLNITLNFTAQNNRFLTVDPPGWMRYYVAVPSDSSSDSDFYSSFSSGSVSAFSSSSRASSRTSSQVNG